MKSKIDLKEMIFSKIEIDYWIVLTRALFLYGAEGRPWCMNRIINK